MTAYFIADVTITDDTWVPEYAKVVHDIAAKHGGKYLSRSGGIETLEGPKNESTLIAIIQFPDRAAAHAFANDPEYAPHSDGRQKGSVSKVVVIDDTDLAGTIPYLTKA